MTTGQAAPAQRRPELQAVASPIASAGTGFSARSVIEKTSPKTAKQPRVAPKVEALLSA